MDVFVARQPIFDAANGVAGYELLYRSNAQENWAEGASAERMSSDVIVHTFLGIGLERITDGKVAFLNVTREMLVADLWKMFDPRQVVIELLEGAEADPDTLAACGRLRAGGYTLALDDFVYEPALEPLLHAAGIVKVDVLGRSAGELAATARRLRPFGVRLLAEKVETEGVRADCMAAGFELFQGYYFSRPEILARREVSVEQANTIRLMNLLRDLRATDAEVEEAFRANPALSFKLLRIARSAALAGRGIRSIRHAVQLVGREMLHRWLALLLVSSLVSENAVRNELVHTAVLRARLCERLAEAGGRSIEAASSFMVGLFSLLDTLLRVPMGDILARVDLAPEVRSALLREGGPYASALDLVEAYERGRWDEVSRISAGMGVSALEVPELYLQSLAWARERVRVAAG